MKLRNDNHIELSYANLKALMQGIERKMSEGRTPETVIYKRTNDVTIAVTVVSDEAHYSEQELADRKSPYLAPEAWAGVL